jgi:aldose 1-epimerase
MASNDVIRLTAGALELQLSPSTGGSICGFHWLGGEQPVSILRECNSSNENVLAASCFPMVPFVNRIRGGQFAFRGRDVRLAPNMAGDISPLHGQGWLAAWRVERSDAASADLAFDHPAGEWPWAYAASQAFALDPAGLTATLACRNQSDQPMPCGLGHHPYFPCGPNTRIDSAAECVWTIDEHVLPVDKVPATGRFALRDRLVCGQDLDHGFGGWSGAARMTDPDWPFELTMSSPTARFFQIFSPPAGGFFVAEPASHANAALNAPEADWPGLGLHVLTPGETMSVTMRIDVRVK